MGNISRDSFQETQNTLNDLRSLVSPAQQQPKHYVSIRLQQGVPVLDADWNEHEDIRRTELETILARAIGSGVPVGSDGFHIVEANPNADTLLIKAGLLFLDGWLVYNRDDVDYINQPHRESSGVAPALPLKLDVAPLAGKKLVYVDAWEREVDSEEDDKLVDDRIGIETCIRLERAWVVRMAVLSAGADPLDPASIPDKQPGHRYYPLALVNRSSQPITAGIITDLRRLHLTLEDTTKAPLEIYGPLGQLTYTLDNFATMLGITEKAYFDLLKSDLFMAKNFAFATPFEVVILSAVFNETRQAAKDLQIQAKIRNLNNQDGLQALEMLYTAQSAFTTEIGSLAAGKAEKIGTSNLIAKLKELLDGGLTGTPPGLKKAVLTDKNLQAAIKAQEDINREIGNRTLLLPHGHLSVRLVGGPALGTVISAGGTYRYAFQISYEQITPLPYRETFDLITAMDPPGWTATLVGLPAKTVTLNTGETVAVQVDITIPAGTAVTTAKLQLRVRSQLNPTEMDTTNIEAALTIGAGGTQPSPLDIQLLSPAINVTTDTLSVGRGVPVGLAGKAQNLQIKFSYLENVLVPVDFKVTFVSLPANVFESLTELSFPLGAGAGPDTTKQPVLQATMASVNGTTGTLTVRVEKKNEATVYKEMTIMLKVQK